VFCVRLAGIACGGWLAALIAPDFRRHGATFRESIDPGQSF
jgi:hypothetical protein